MRRICFAFIACTLLPGLLIAKDCKFQIHRHERHVKASDKAILYERAGITDRSCCVVDHIVPLELGGTNLLSNLQLQTKADGKAKDALENHLAKLVCDGLITVRQAQDKVKQWKAAPVP